MLKKQQLLSVLNAKAEDMFGRQEKMTIRTRLCKRCGNLIRTEFKFKFICDDCILPNGYNSKHDKMIGGEQDGNFKRFCKGICPRAD